ncbi:diguanylate cyclase domain-containing protein [Domibacillus robiginosus]|uniref:diguanylate cyclase domain-containing protein n=1 Tax=Domibacillus robiginosus TaxID=1071054 RepID=UPI00067CBDE1|nr:diguanylate cyclase [Domibacillus robiginosus]
MLQKDLLDQAGALQYLFESHPDGICIVDVEGQFLYVNAAVLTMFGYKQEEILQTSLDQLFYSSSVNSDNSGRNIKARSTLAIRHKKGFLVYVRLTSIPLVSDGQETGSFIRFEDITQQVNRSKGLLDIQEMFSFISEKSQNIISSTSADGIFTYISPTVEALLGYTPEEVIGKPAASFNPPDTNKKFQEHRNSLFIDQDTERFTGRVRHKNGEYRWFETTAEYIRDPSGEIIQTISVGRDITDRKEAEEKIMHLAYRDSVTDLPNRRLFKKRVSLLLGESKNEQHVHALMLLDLDGFKYVNDTFGHDVGDLLLIEVAKRLIHTVGEEDFVARWGGDEFTVFQVNIENRSDLISLMERIKDVIAEPMIISDHTLCVTASIGISFFPEEGDTVEALFKNADKAMYRAKKQAKNRA